MKIKRWTSVGTTFCLWGLLAVLPSWAATNDREYLLGDDSAEGASNGNTVGTTFDSQGQSGMNQLIDLNAVGGPVYRTITGRPDGGGGLGIEFNGSQQYLRGQSLNWPQQSFSAIASGVGTLNYNGIVDRGFQFWVQPAASGAQSLVIDTNQHGARINADGNFSMRYDSRDTDTGVAATPGTWFHVMVVRPEGAAGGSRMYIDGVAVAADNESDYAADLANLVLGSNTGGDDQNFTGGTEEFFTGILDDLTMFVIGDNSNDPGPPPGQDWGDFDFATDNAFAAFTLTGVPGDVNNDGSLDQLDKDGFIAGWMQENLVNGIRMPDLNSHSAGDLNFDGVTDIFDLSMIQNALTSSGLGAITSAELAGAVPEPSTAALLIGITVATIGLRRYR